ncbi:sulfur carrier protein ThiS [Microbacterium capsulatum]|uniref:Sulfur carrier protein ThiS n=1 Tax=Microbacterium capsulatum TaxID=3041921 RepID=A0ABU0XHQ9_9MICO|nr:sulfur carrier protein ThiS [Microbacterium sp. ASV81]MDQ4214675.1 sulfur carrier protein ThiS [Microbacterium sp. ASV81]
MMTDTLTVRVNGDEHAVASGATLLDLVVRLTGHALRPDGSRADGGRLGVAAAVDGTVVPRSRWSARALAAGDEIEVVTAVQGG